MILSRKNFLSIAIILAVAITLASAGYLDRFQNVLSDQRMSNAHRDANGKIVFIGIDKKSLDNVGTWPWPRSTYAKAIQELNAKNVGEIAFDVDFSTPSIPSEDEKFAQSLSASAASIVLPTFLQNSVIGDEQTEFVQSKPIEMLADNAWIASVNVVPDLDGLVRTYPIANEINGELTPSMSSVLASENRLDDGNFNIDYSIDPSSIPTYSMSDLLDGSIPALAIEGKTVLIGAYALELRDTLVVPVHGVISGPILQILAAETLLQKRTLKTLSTQSNLAILIFLALLVLIVLPKMKLLQGIASLLVLAILTEAVARYLFLNNAIQLETAPALVFIGLNALYHTLNDLDLRAFLLKLARIEVANTRLVLNQVFDDSSDGIIILDENGILLERNTQSLDILRQVNGPIDKNSFAESLPETLKLEAHSAIQRIRQKSNNNIDLTSTGNFCLDQAGHEKHIEYRITPSRVQKPTQNAETKIELSCIASIILRDVTVEMEQRRRLEYLSRFDEMTGAERRNEFVKRIELSSSGSADCAVFTLGILRFENLIATMGRELGNQLLITVLKKIKSADPLISGVALLGRSTLAIRLSPTARKSFIESFPSFILAILAEPINVNKQLISIDLCIGYAQSNSQVPLEAGILVNQAEFALQQARSLGPNGICLFNAHTEAAQKRARQLEQAMSKSLDAGEFHLEYQPQIHAGNERAIGAEALIRWTHPELGRISPGEFVEVAETTGFIVQLGQFALNQACNDAMEWDENLSISVNISPLQLLRGDVVADVRDALEFSELPASRLIIELTESSFLGDENDILGKLEALKNLGVSVALDDFGTGYSSLGYLARFPMDKIKIDQSFVRDIDGSPSNQAIIRSTKVLADGLNIGLLCEGVETETELKLVQQLGCQEIQGYYFSKPLTAPHVLQFFDELRSKPASKSPKRAVA